MEECTFTGCDNFASPEDDYCPFHMELVESFVTEEAPIPLATDPATGRQHWDGFHQIRRKGRGARDTSHVGAEVNGVPGWPIHPSYTGRSRGSRWIPILERLVDERMAVVVPWPGVTASKVANVLSSTLRNSKRTCKWKWSVRTQQRRSDDGQLESVVVAECTGEWMNGE